MAVTPVAEVVEVRPPDVIIDTHHVDDKFVARNGEPVKDPNGEKESLGDPNGESLGDPVEMLAGWQAKPRPTSVVLRPSSAALLAQLASVERSLGAVAVAGSAHGELRAGLVKLKQRRAGLADECRTGARALADATSAIEMGMSGGRGRDRNPFGFFFIPRYFWSVLIVVLVLSFGRLRAVALIIADLMPDMSSSLSDSTVGNVEEAMGSTRSQRPDD